MRCPRCHQNNTTLISNSHYVCNNNEYVRYVNGKRIVGPCSDEDGNRTQFSFVIDDSFIINDKASFPYNQIFINRLKENFYRKPYLKINTTKSNIVIK